jgi:hypothetical protein
MDALRDAIFSYRDRKEMYICTMKYLTTIMALFFLSCSKGNKYTCKGVKDGNVITEQKRFKPDELAAYNQTPIFWKYDTSGNALHIYPECK